jgi:anti-sigma factor RsiW
MVCESWKTQLDTYLDGQLPSVEMYVFDSHVRICPSCAADALARVQMKRTVQAAGKWFTPSAEFRRRVQQSIAAAKPRRDVARFGWMMATAMIAVLLVAGLATYYMERQRSGQKQTYSELADLHVATLASSSPVDVVSTDRHTVKPWFQGKIPFTFDLPELQNSKFSLLGGRITYLGQTPGAHLIYEVQKHKISVFIFQEGSLRGRWYEESPVTQELSFNMETWGQGSLRYCILGDAAAADINNLAELLKHAAGS